MTDPDPVAQLNQQRHTDWSYVLEEPLRHGTTNYHMTYRRIFASNTKLDRNTDIYIYSRTTIARTPVARLQWLIRTRL